jgi:RNA-directed DNA polymerase
VKGKIEFLGMVRGREDNIYLRFRKKLWTLAPEFARELLSEGKVDTTTTKPLVITEGKTDWKHLEAAFGKLKGLGYFESLEIEFQKSETPRGDDLLNMCKHYSETFHGRPIVFIFDRDKPNIVKQVSGGEGYKLWGNDVFSFAILS